MDDKKNELITIIYKNKLLFNFDNFILWYDLHFAGFEISKDLTFYNFNTYREMRANSSNEIYNVYIDETKNNTNAIIYILNQCKKIKNKFDSFENNNVLIQPIREFSVEEIDNYFNTKTIYDYNEGIEENRKEFNFYYYYENFKKN